MERYRSYGRPERLCQRGPLLPCESAAICPLVRAFAKPQTRPPNAGWDRQDGLSDVGEWGGVFAGFGGPEAEAGAGGDEALFSGELVELAQALAFGGAELEVQVVL